MGVFKGIFEDKGENENVILGEIAEKCAVK